MFFKVLGIRGKQESAAMHKAEKGRVKLPQTLQKRFNTVCVRAFFVLFKPFNASLKAILKGEQLAKLA